MSPAVKQKEDLPKKRKTSMAGNITNAAAPITSSLSKLQSLNGLFAIYKKQGPTSADVLNKLKEALLKGSITGLGSAKKRPFCCPRGISSRTEADLVAFVEGWNNHPVRTEGNHTPEQICLTGMMRQQVDQPENLEEIQESEIKWGVAADYGEDVDGVVVVPEFDCPLTEHQLTEVHLLIEQNDDNDTRHQYLLCRQYVTTLSGV